MVGKGPKELHGMSQLSQKTGIKGSWEHWDPSGVLRVGRIFPVYSTQERAVCGLGRKGKTWGRIPGKWEQLENPGMSAEHPQWGLGRCIPEKGKNNRDF